MKSGFFAAYGTSASNADVTARGLGKPYILVDPGLALKKFPCCYACHRAMDGLLALREELHFEAAGVEKIVCRMPPGGMLVLTYPRPVTGLEGKFSLEYCLAAGALDGKYGLSTFTDDAVRRPAIESLYTRISAIEDAACRGDDPQFDNHSSGSRGFVEVEVALKDGRSAKKRIDHPPGHPKRELTWNDLSAKFADCAVQSQRVSARTAEDAFNRIRTLEQAADIREVIHLLQG